MCLSVNYFLVVILFWVDSCCWVGTGQKGYGGEIFRWRNLNYIKQKWCGEEIQSGILLFVTCEIQGRIEASNTHSVVICATFYLCLSVHFYLFFHTQFLTPIVAFYQTFPVHTQITLSIQLSIIYRPLHSIHTSKSHSQPSLTIINNQKTLSSRYNLFITFIGEF